jgi:hypothetical protein
MRLICDFKVTTQPATHRCGAVISANYIPPIARFEVSNTVWPRGEQAPKDSQITGVIWPAQRQECWEKGKEPRPVNEVEYSGGTPPTTIGLRLVPPKLASRNLYWEIAVRMDIDGDRKTHLPCSWYRSVTLKNENSMSQKSERALEVKKI